MLNPAPFWVWVDSINLVQVRTWERPRTCIYVFSRVPPQIPIHDLYSLQWRNYGHDDVSNHQLHDCLLKRLFRRRSKKTSKLRVTGLCAWNSPVTGEFPAQSASNTENVSIWWRHHAFVHNHWGRYIWEGEVLRMRHRVASLAWVNRMIVPFSVA